MLHDCSQIINSIRKLNTGHFSFQYIWSIWIFVPHVHELTYFLFEFLHLKYALHVEQPEILASIYPSGSTKWHPSFAQSP